MALGAAELAAVVDQHRADRQVQPGIKRQPVVVQHRDRGLGLLGDVQEAEDVAAEGVDHGRQIDPADTFEGADHEGVRGQQLTRPLALDVALANDSGGSR